MEIFSFLIIVGLMLSSCTTDDGDEEMAVFTEDIDLNKWRDRQRVWVNYKEKSQNPLWYKVDPIKEKSLRPEPAFVGVKNQDLISPEKVDDETARPVYSKATTAQNTEVEHVVLEEY